LLCVPSSAMDHSRDLLDRVRQSLASVEPACGHLDMALAGQVALSMTQHAAQLDDQRACNVLIDLSRGIGAGQASAARWPLCAAVHLLVQRTAAAGQPCALAALTSVFLPFLAAHDTAAEQRRQVIQAVVASIADSGAWGRGCRLVQAATQAADAAPSSLGDQALEEIATSLAPSSLGGQALEEIATSLAAVPGPVQAELAAELLAAAYAAPGGAEELLAYAGAAAFPAALRMLCTDPAGAAAAALGRHLLPALLAAAQRCGGLGDNVALLWGTCRRLTAAGAAPRDRCIGLALLVQFHAPLLQHGRLVDAPELWALLLDCLESDDVLERKRGLHVLEAAVAHLQGQSGQEELSDAAKALALAPWGLFLKLYETLEETAVNLFEVGAPSPARARRCVQPTRQSHRAIRAARFRRRPGRAWTCSTPGQPPCAQGRPPPPPPSLGLGTSPCLSLGWSSFGARR